MDTNTLPEKRLKHDINRKNVIRNEIEKRIKAVYLWKDKLVSSNCFQKQKQYSASIKRYIAEIESLRSKLNQMNEELDKRIRDVGNYSASRIKKFQSELEQELGNVESDKDVKKTKKRQKKGVNEKKNAQNTAVKVKGNGGLQRKIEKLNKKLSKDFEEIEQATGKIMKLSGCLKEIGKSAEHGDEGFDGDKYFFTQELKHIIREKAIYG